jgi:hypothetical protein
MLPAWRPGDCCSAPGCGIEERGAGRCLNLVADSEPIKRTFDPVCMIIASRTVEA